MNIGLGISLVGEQAIFSPSALLAGSTAMVWLDPSDLTTLFQDSAGTTPVTAAGQPVGLVLDKSQGLVLGPELVTNGDFSSGSAGWSTPAGWSISGGQANAAVASGFADLRGATNIASIGKTYRVSFTVSVTSGGVRLYFGGVTSATTLTTSGAYSFIITASAADYVAIIPYGSGGSFTGTIDNISVRELPGFHATQSTAASRPTYGVVPSRGRVNLLTYTEFPNGVSDADIRGGLLTATTFSGVVGNAGIAFGHDGSTTTFAYKSGFAAVSTQYTLSVLVRMTDGNAPSFGAASATAASNDFALIIGGSVPSPSSYTVTSLGGGLFRVSATATTLSTLPSNHTGVLKYSTNSNRTFTTSGWQLELGSAFNSYQRVVSQFDVTDPTGFPSYPCYYLSFDGVDDFLVTPTITPNADKVQVFAGVRKLSDAVTGVIAELSTTLNTNAGTFFMLAPNADGSTSAVFASKGSLPQFGAGAVANIGAAPVTRVLSGLADISADSSILRYNGIQVAQSIADQGTGNYLAYPLYIGRRAGTLLPFNGQLFQLITRFSTANLDVGLIGQTERFVGQKTGVTI